MPPLRHRMPYTFHMGRVELGTYEIQQCDITYESKYLAVGMTRRELYVDIRDGRSETKPLHQGHFVWS
jgi:hypothetical protein